MSVAKPQKPGLIDTISAGYGTLLTQPWVLVVPVLLDLAFWLGVRLSFAPLWSLVRADIASALETFTETLQQREDLTIALINADMREVLAWFNVVPLYTPDALGQGVQFTRSTITVDSPGGVLLAFVLLNSLLLVASSLLLAGLTTAVRRHTPNPTTYWRSFGVALRAVAGYFLLLLGILVGLGVPFLLVAGLLVQFIPALLSFVVVTAFVVWFWIRVYTGFTIEAALISDSGPLRALLRSVRLVQTHFWAAVGLLVLSALIELGLGTVWTALTQSIWGLLVAMLGHALVGTGLVAARLIFYRDRWVTMEEP